MNKKVLNRYVHEVAELYVNDELGNDEEDFDEFLPVSCQHDDARIMMSEIIHRLTDKRGDQH